MFSLGTKLTGIGILLSVCLFTIYQYGQSKEREGMAKIINARLETDNAALIQSSQKMADAFQQTQAMLNELRQNPDSAPAPASIASTVKRLCDQRKARNLPCNTAKPTRKTNER